jgi:hypothetical protein
VEEPKTPTTTDEEDVEAHGYSDRPTDRPTDELDAASDEPEVEGHGFTDRPTDRPTD